MPFYIRKSVSVGPLRFNLSNSGIGVSAGVPGFRVGTGPRGNYVHMGRGGIYYRATLNGGPPNARPTRPDADGLIAIESGDVAAMTDSSSVGLLDELNTKRGRWQFWPFIALGGAAIVLSAGEQLGPVISAAVAGITVLATWATYELDRMRKTTVILYDIEDDALQRLRPLYDAHDGLSQAGGMWHFAAAGATSDWKRNAGASTLVRRSAIRPHAQPPRWVQTNIAVPALPVGRQTLYFFPDRVLVFDNNRVGAVNYEQLQIQVGQRQFIEEDPVPTDARVVGSTWRYVNKKGGPDRRFKNNRELPIALYEQLDFTSDTGLTERIQVSKIGAGEAFARALSAVRE
jgi:hypothetical protein